MATFAPSEARRLAIAAPMPRDPARDQCNLSFQFSVHDFVFLNEVW